MFYCINPNYRYRFFSPDDMGNNDNPFDDSERDPVVDDNPANEPKHNLVNALAALYKAYGGEEELNNNAVDIIYKIADVINEKNNTPDTPPQDDQKLDPNL